MDSSNLQLRKHEHTATTYLLPVSWCGLLVIAQLLICQAYVRESIVADADMAKHPQIGLDFQRVV